MADRSDRRSRLLRWYGHAAARSRVNAAVLLITLAAACAPSVRAGGSASAALVPREVVLTFDPPRRVVGVRPGGREGRLDGVARLHGRVRRATQDSLVLRVVHAWDADGRPLGLPLSFEVRIARAEAGQLDRVSATAAGRERQVAIWLVTIVGGYFLLLALTMPRS